MSPTKPLSLALTILLPALAASPAGAREAAVPTAPSELARVEIGDLGWRELARLEGDREISWWVELDRTLVLAAPSRALDRISLDHRLERLPTEPADGPLVFVYGAGAERDPRWRPIARGGPWTLARLARSASGLRLEELPEGGPLPRTESGQRAAEPPRLFRFRPDLVLARSAANLVPSPTGSADQVDPTLVDLVDADRWFAADEALANWNRWTRGSEIQLARDWLVAQFSALPRTSVETQQFIVPSPTTTAWNVLATLPGLEGGDRLVIVGGHYDSTSESPSTAAPGAEDNASGCAGVLEMARIFAYRRPLATLVFACYSGEEQGLWGSEAHASSVVAAGRAGDVELMLDMDMIGFTEDADLDCLLETSSSFSSLFATFQAAAAQFTTLRIVTSTFPYGSDHVPFIDRGMPGLLTIENDWSSYPYYHSTLDLPGNLSLDMGEGILRMNVAVVAEIAGMPIFTGDFEIGDTSFWSSVVN